MNKQQVFDVVYKHLMQQGKKATALLCSDSCAYRAHDGLKCAIGILIPDFQYSPQMELCGSVLGLLDHYPNALGFPVDWDMRFFLRELQLIHDHSPVSVWKNRLVNLAAVNNVTIPE